MKERTNQEIRTDLEVNIIQFHEEKHKRNDKTIVRLEEEAAKLREEADHLRDETAKLKEQISDWKKNIPMKRDIGSQVFLINKSKGSDKIGANSASGFSLFL
jgi:predicted  nucleic acid-binding Zn-ribbon protein